MRKKSPSRVTQVMERPSLSEPPVTDLLHTVTRMIENGEENRRIFNAIVECATTTSGVEAAAVFLPSDKTNTEKEMVASYGNYSFANLPDEAAQGTNRIALQALGASARKSSIDDDHFFDVVCVGAPVGYLAVHAPKGLRAEALLRLSGLAHHTGVVFERQKLSGTLQHFLDRVQVLNELNQLIASNVPLQRIVKSLARESAFRFASDVAITFLLSDAKTYLEPRGGYGCSPSVIPTQIDLDSGILGQVMRVGGHLSVVNLEEQSTHALGFLCELGVKSVDVCCLEVKGESLGALLIGCRRPTVISPNDLIRFEEFCQGAAVAIANARSQERITSYTERLEELVATRTADLEVQTARAEEANKAKSQFLANMSHELRTPLTAIVGYGSVLSDGVFGPLNDKQRDAINAVTRSSEHLKNLIDEVLNLARIESGKEEPEPAPVSVKELLLQSHKLMMQTALQKGVSIRPFQCPPELAATQIYADQKHLQQIVINLMGNAVKYTPKGGSVWVDIEVVVDKLKINVSDSGVGIPPHKLAKLFERFERGEDAYSKNQEGTGIGLNLTRRLVELNGGRIGVTSEVGQGSVFWILLPLATGEQMVVTQVETTQQKIRLDGLSTIVVDDNSDTCEVLKHILIAAGATVRIAQTVKEGYALLEQSAPDIVLTDLAIPGESGLVLIERIRNAATGVNQIPIIVLSACAFESDKTMALNAGASLFLPKPFKPNEVLKSVRQLTLNMAMQG